MKEYLVTYLNSNGKIQVETTLADNAGQAQYQVEQNCDVSIMYGAILKNT